MTLSDLYEKGFAVRVYNINNDVSSWRHREKVIDLPTGAVETHMVEGFERPVARWQDVIGYRP